MTVPALVLLLALLAAGCGTGKDVVGGPDITGGPVLVRSGEVVAVRGDRSIAAVGADGSVRRLAVLPDDAGEPDAVAVSGDGRVVLVSAVRLDDDDPSVCRGTVLQLLEDGELQEVAEGASVALSQDDAKVAWFRHATVDGYCRRTGLVVRELTSGEERTVLRLQDAPVGATPPSWPVSWSPEGDRVAHVTEEGAVVTDVDSGATTAVTPAVGRALAPAWLPDGRLVVLDGCCIGGAAVRAVDGGEVVFPVSRPVRSIRPGRDGTGAWVVLEEAGLHRWEDSTPLRPVLEDVLVASG